MKKHLFPFAAMLLALPLSATDPTPGKAAFNKLKSLAGEWTGTSQNGKARLVYEVTAGGSAILERETAEKHPGMMTMFHMDGDRLLLTHYCMAGNQPRMQAQAYDPASNTLEFRFLDATSLKSPNAGHMHNVKFRFLDKDRFVSEWEFYENGKSKFTETAEYTRVR